MSIANRRIAEDCSKGTVLQKETPYKILSVGKEARWMSSLPQYPRTTKAMPVSSKVTRAFLENKEPTVPTLAVALALEVVLDGDDEACRRNASPPITPIECQDEQEQLSEAWIMVQACIEWEEWVRLYQEIKAQVLVFHEPMVSTFYATKTIFALTPDERHVLDRQLKHHQILPCVNHESSNNAHVLSQALQDITETVAYAVLLYPPYHHAKHQFQHSYLPNVSLEFDSNTQMIQWIALYDLEKKEPVHVSLVDATLPTTKELQDRFGASFHCPCVKCSHSNDLTIREMQRLGHLCMQQEQYDQAKRWYRRVLKVEPRNLDMWHALGAVSLQQKHFLQAQRIWKQAPEGNHDGISLQLEKQRCFRYFDRPRFSSLPSNVPPFTDVFSSGQCFVTDRPIVSKKMCLQIMDWANQHDKEWTTSRHYAVPTQDVPVHRVPSLLSWFRGWMNNVVSCLLQAQFGFDAANFFVHDAFVVCYNAQQHNHLPLHYDESTHSLVLALNNDFEGGGTYFHDYQQSLNPEQGVLVSFCGDKLRHGGNVVTKGRRYILAVFLYHDADGDSSEAADEERKRRQLPKVLESSKRSKFSFGFDLS